MNHGWSIGIVGRASGSTPGAHAKTRVIGASHTPRRGSAGRMCFGRRRVVDDGNDGDSGGGGDGGVGGNGNFVGRGRGRAEVG